MYLLIDFGVLGPLVGLSNGSVAPFRAAAEAGIATTLFAFLFVYLNLHRWHLRFLTLALALTIVFFALFGFAFFQPALAATISRLVLALLGLTGFFLILLLALRGYDRAVLLVPTWIIYIAWLFYAWLVVSGQVSNDVAQPAVAGGLESVRSPKLSAVRWRSRARAISSSTGTSSVTASACRTNSQRDWANGVAHCAVRSSAGSIGCTRKIRIASAQRSIRSSNCVVARCRPICGCRPAMAAIARSACA
jgi:hypothetical protein